MIFGLNFFQIVLTLIATIFCIEIIFRLPFLNNLFLLKNLLYKLINLFRSSNISDHWKEKVYLNYDKKLFYCSILIPIHLFLSFLPLSLILLFFENFDLIANIKFIIILSIFSLIYLKLRMK